MSIGAYFEKVAEADSPVEVARIERWHLLPELLETLAARVADGLNKFAVDIRHRVQIVFTAHSLPERILEWNDPYPDELRATVEGVVRLLAVEGIGNAHEFAYQSAAMTPDPWLGPDAGDVITRLHEQDVPGALIVPVGFTSEHVEILYDIDVELAHAAENMGFALQRISMLNDDKHTMSGLARLVRQAARHRGWG